MNALYLIAVIDGSRVAIQSDLVEAVVRVNDVIPVPKSNPSVAGLFALRSRVLTLIDSQALITGRAKAPEKGALAIIAEIDGHAYALLVDAVDDVVVIETDAIETTINPGPEWQKLATGICTVDDKLVMIVDPAQLVGGREMMAA